ncbi:hypothetical protein [Pseudoalteromonas denitrificans]|uniref:Solute-binding protein family 3/N-terminal domain-containing protein n=1 Tax=Pseudoalteromonas denitrificans DSM 6059 TaxID=1123010 RepID=A0A1I1UMC2_9GAMM|nr:hypothetical protein [Pseudoalteromonas denitrificans]SFD69120.1 hypothetical protein SAMN02745724_05207 [Pseudoalteromonas denitrificans DSM 6059]
MYKCRFIFIVIFFINSLQALAAPQQQISSDCSSLLNKSVLNVSSRSNEALGYYSELLKRSLKNIGCDLTINYIGKLSYQRQNKYLKNNKLSLMWRLKSDVRDMKYLRVDEGLTNKLITHRVLFIPQATQYKYSEINNKSDFIKSNLVGVFGEGWFDVDVWRVNHLPYIELSGDREKIYSMLESKKRGFDYFSRGINEIISESKRYPNLAIEKELLFVYQNDMYFYVNKENDQLKAILEYALLQAKESGLFEALLFKYWGDIQTQLSLPSRKVIKLDMP